MFDSSFMKLILVASSEFAAYLVSSEDFRLMKIRRSRRLRQNGAYRSRMTSIACSSSVPMTMRSGFMKSSIAAPSFRNSGLEMTA